MPCRYYSLTCNLLNHANAAQPPHRQINKPLNTLSPHPTRQPPMSETPKIPDGILASQVKALEAELKEAVALLEAEREANAEAVARFQAEKEEAAAQLDAERKARDAERKAKVEAVRKLATVVAEINSDATLQARRRRADATATSVEAPDPDDPMVRKVGPNMLSKNMTINCRSDVTIHEDPIIFLDALLGDQTKVGKMLYQKRVEEYVFYWSFMASNTKSCDLLLRMWVERQDEDGVVVRVESVEEVGERENKGRNTGLLLTCAPPLQSSKLLQFLTRTQRLRRSSGFSSRRGPSSCGHSNLGR